MTAGIAMLILLGMLVICKDEGDAEEIRRIQKQQENAPRRRRRRQAYVDHYA